MSGVVLQELMKLISFGSQSCWFNLTHSSKLVVSPALDLTLSKYRFWLRFGLVNAINTYLRLKILVCGPSV